MIEASIILSAAVGHWAELAIITVLLIANVIGFWEEYQAGNTVKDLKAKLAIRARVKRDGAWKTIFAREPVPGDLVRVRLGDIIPAEGRLLDADPIQVDQSALTGEYPSAEVNTGDTVYSGSVVIAGEASVLVQNIDAVRETCSIFRRMCSYAVYRIAETIRVLLFMTSSVLVFNFYTVTAVMIVLLALLKDGAILSVAYDRAHASQEPEKRKYRR